MTDLISREAAAKEAEAVAREAAQKYALLGPAGFGRLIAARIRAIPAVPPAGTDVERAEAIVACVDRAFRRYGEQSLTPEDRHAIVNTATAAFTATRQAALAESVSLIERLSHYADGHDLQEKSARELGALKNEAHLFVLRARGDHLNPAPGPRGDGR